MPIGTGHADKRRVVNDAIRQVYAVLGAWPDVRTMTDAELVACRDVLADDMATLREAFRVITDAHA